MRGKVCAVFGCSNYEVEKNALSFFRYPCDKKMCDLWVLKCHRSDLDKVYKKEGTLRLYKNYKICSDHFQANDFKNPRPYSQGCKDQRIQAGGNAVNNCTVLSALGVTCEYMGYLSNCHYSKMITEHLKKCGIHFENCVYREGDSVFPNSSVIVNNQNGSRTIMHFRKNWPEVTLEDFKKLDLSQYSWVHFEGRNVEEIRKMVSWIDCWREANPVSSLRVSIEIEKPRPDLVDLLPIGDVLFIGKDFSRFRGYVTMAEVLEKVTPLIKKNATVIVPWGELGATARNPDGEVVHSPAFPPQKVVDTLGAGDTFCAAVISALNSKHSLKDSIVFGCQVAGAKVGMYGYEGLDIFCNKTSKAYLVSQLIT